MDFTVFGLGQGEGLLFVIAVLTTLYFSLPLLQKPLSSRIRTQSGNIFFTLFGAVALVGVVGAAGMSVIKGPVRSMHTVTQRTIAENNMIASAKLSVISSSQLGDCDGDGTIEPVAWTNTGTGPKPTGGGYLPSSIGAALEDPWGNMYGYCVWDHGSAINKTTPAPICPTPADRLSGVAAANGPVIAVLSAGPDRVYQTTCGNGPTYVTKAPGSDDIVLMHTYAEASALAAGLWNIKSGAPGIAEINKDLEVKNASNAVVFGVDSTTDTSKPSIKVDYIKALANTSVEYLSNIELGSTWLSGDGGNEGIRVDSTGRVGVGTASPVSILHVKAATNQNVFVAANTNGPDTGAVGFAAVNDANNAYTPLGFIGSRFSFNTGSVGIGTLAPAQKLDVAGSIRSTAYTYINMADPTIVMQDTDHRSAAMHTNGNAFYILTGNGVNGTGFTVNGGAWPLSINLNNDDITFGGAVYLNEGGLTLNSGNLNVGGNAITSNAGTLRDAGGGWMRTYGQTGWYSQTYGGGWHMVDTTWLRAYADKNIFTPGEIRAGVFTYNSDIRLKENIKPLGDTVLRDLQGLRSVRYNYIADEKKRPRIGVIAQEVEKVYPELVATDPESGNKAVDYPGLVPVLLEAIKELEAQNKALTERVEKLEAK